MIRILLAGQGGQGVLSAGRFLAESGLHEGREVSYLPAYGPEMRGGSANCSVVISDDSVGSPKVESADVVIAMNRPSMEAFEKNVVSGGLLLYNESLIDVKPSRTDIRAIGVRCNDIADELKSAKVANMAMLGAYLGVTGQFTVDAMMDALRHKLGPSKEKWMPLNRAAIEAGMKAVQA